VESPNISEKLDEIANLVINILTRSLQAGRVYIVTNAMTDWVHYSCSKWIPTLTGLLDQLDIISAREMFEETHPKPSLWKINAFKELSSKHLKPDNLVNIVCMGDSN